MPEVLRNSFQGLLIALSSSNEKLAEVVEFVKFNMVSRIENDRS